MMSLYHQSDIIMTSPKKKTFTARFNPEDYDGLVELGNRTDRSINWLINDAVRQYLNLNKKPEEKNKDGNNL